MHGTVHDTARVLLSSVRNMANAAALRIECKQLGLPACWRSGDRTVWLSSDEMKEALLNWKRKERGLSIYSLAAPSAPGASARFWSDDHPPFPAYLASALFSISPLTFDTRSERRDVAHAFWSNFDNLVGQARLPSYCQMGLASAISHGGLHVVLWTYGVIKGLPQGVEVRSASDVFPLALAQSARNSGVCIQHISDMVRFIAIGRTRRSLPKSF